MMQAETGRYVGYITIKFLMSITTSILLGIVGLIVLLGLLVPSGALSIAAVFGGKVAGLTWNLYTIAAAVIAGIILLVVVFCLMAFISVPVTVFFPAYSIHFFADRYPPLAQLIYPPKPSPS
jgi:CBS-domain-containing membrane protein